MTPKKPIEVLVYLPDRGALVYIDPQDIPVAFENGVPFQATITLSLDGHAKTYDLTFELKKETVSATGLQTPAVGLGFISGLQEGPSSIGDYSISNVSKRSPGPHFKNSIAV